MPAAPSLSLSPGIKIVSDALEKSCKPAQHQELIRTFVTQNYTVHNEYFWHRMLNLSEEVAHLSNQKSACVVSRCSVRRTSPLQCVV